MSGFKNIGSSNSKVVSFEHKPERKAGQKFEGEAEEIARSVAQLLDTEANVI